MKRFFLLVFVAVSASASVGLYSSSPDRGAIFARNSLVTFQFVPFVNTVDETAVVVDFNAAPATIESANGAGFSCTTSGTTAQCTRALFPANTTGAITVQVRMPAGLSGFHVVVSAKITAASGSTATWAPDVFVPKTFVVNDLGRGFAEAIMQANIACGNTTDPCAIEFGVSGSVSGPLPAIDARNISLDAGKKITLDGTGLVIQGRGKFTISGFTIQNNEGPGILLLPGEANTTTNVEIKDTVSTGNLRGLMAYGTDFLYAHDNDFSGNRRSGVWIIDGYYPAIYENKITDNGASGVYFGAGCQFGMADDNTITGNRDFGVAIDPKARWIEVRSNSMKENGQLGIDYNLDLVTPNVPDDSHRNVPNAPVLTSAKFDPASGKTTITGHVDLIKPADVGYYAPLIDIYRSSALDAHGMAQGEQPLFIRTDYGQPVQHDAAGNFTYVYNGDLTGQYISATYSRMYALGKGAPQPQYYENWQATSEFSNPVRVER